ncbi:hypothetical protein ACJDU8_02355 [Clostridium sp. WILCCON 0269]|uniref:MORN repeat protein n=1 Tax=Candidatus Clostridium eludens TaxID=3381663 RepID=A0ABW8SFW0_9CLOT
MKNIQNFNGKLILDQNDFPKLSETIYYLICTYTLIVTAIFSWAILQSSIESNKLAKEIKNKEDNKENEVIRENALIVYYDLILGIKDLRKLYVSRIINQKSAVPKKLFFSNEWIKNVAVLKNHLSSDEMSCIYNLYGRFLTIAALLDERQTKKDYFESLDEEINNLSYEIYSSIFPKEFLKSYEDDEVKLLNRKYYALLGRLRYLTYKKEEIKMLTDSDNVFTVYLGENISYKGELKNEKYNGRGCYYSIDSKNLKYEGLFENGYFVSGVTKEFYDNGNRMYEVEYKNSNKIKGKLFYKNNDKLCYDGEFDGDGIKNGFVETYYTNHNIHYRGDVKDNKHEGYGVEHYNNKSNSVRYDGNWIQGIIQSGKYFGKGERDIKHFEGEFRNSKPYNGQIKYGNLYFEKTINGFEGEIKEGEPYEGKGMVFFRDYLDRDYETYSYICEEEENSYAEFDEDYDLDIERQYRESRFKNTKDRFSRWEEYIEAEWKNGQFEIKDVNDILNKEIFTYENENQ